MTSTVNQQELEKFSKIASAWWDEDGDFKLLHQINPVRLAYFKEQIIAHFQLDASAQRPFENLTMLDVGCGGGLLSQPLAKLGAKVTAIDAASENIEVALSHNEQHVDYLCSSIEELAQSAKVKYDCILAIEIIEHVANLEKFLASCASLLKPNGILIISTLNQTIPSYCKAIIVAEYLLRWLPKNTHDWRKFLKPSQLANYLRPLHLQVTELAGLNYKILQDSWYISKQIDTNYIAICKFIS
jgi:2-polyprenyl-6-hydroxyphenyl methylase / 3-demethylubiquinone-9 3-methyltransferase